MTIENEFQIKPMVPNEIIYRWHKVIDLVLAELRTPVAVITRLEEDSFRIFHTHASEHNPFKNDQEFALEGSFTEWVASRKSCLHIHDARENELWKDHPLISTGLVYYLGFPVTWPDGEVFGTLAVYDSKANEHADKHQELLEEFCHEINQDLVILMQQEELRAEIDRRRMAEDELANFTPKEFHALWSAAHSVLVNRKFDVSARVIFDEACKMTGAKSGYVALLSEDGSENEVLFLDSGGLDCTVDPSLPMPIRGLRAEAYSTHKAVYDNDFMNSKWIEYMPLGHVVLKNVMFSPLNIEGMTVGIMGLANKDSDFTEFDATIAEAFGEMAALALKNSRVLEELDDTNKKLENFNQTLVERELRIIEVKQEVNELCKELGKEPLYKETSAML